MHSCRVLIYLTKMPRRERPVPLLLCSRQMEEEATLESTARHLLGFLAVPQPLSFEPVEHLVKFNGAVTIPLRITLDVCHRKLDVAVAQLV